MPTHFRTTISSLISPCKPPPISHNHFFQNASPFPKTLPFARAEHPPELSRSSQPAPPSSGTAWKISHWPSSAISPDRYVGIAPSSPRQTANLPSLLPSSWHLSRLTLGEAPQLLHSFSRRRLPHCPNQIQSAPLAA